MRVEERLWRSGSKSYLRPLPGLLGVSHRGYTKQLQRALTDFGLDHSFALASGKLKEHYGVEVPVSSLRSLTLANASRIAADTGAEGLDLPNCLPQSGVDQLIAEADGSMVPVVRFEGRHKDRRKNRKTEYREARLAACKPAGQNRSFYCASMGSTEQLGLEWNRLAKQSGRGLNSFVHVVCDGAVWIRKQAEEQLRPDRQLLDFFHVCEYLQAAKEGCAGNTRWLGTQKNRLLKNRSSQVIEELRQHLEPPGTVEEDAPVRQAHRYLSNRIEQLDYQGARNDLLPIGSGLIESGHKHVIQARMKIAGAAWDENNADVLIRTRAKRASGYWPELWEN